jgi:flagellar hook assembly protein FlgD
LQRVLTTVTLLGLLVATAAAFAITEHLKLIKSPVFGTLVTKVFSPTCHCSTDTAAVRFRLRHSDHATVTIVDSDHHPVATVVSGYHMVARHAHTFRWDGRTDSGALAPDGVYYPWVHLEHASHSTFKFINRITLDTKVPGVLSASAEKPVLFAGPGRSVAIRYALSEPAHAVVYLGNQQVVVGRPTRTHSRIKWGGTIPSTGQAVPEGRYVLSIAARDDAGNETPRSARKRVTVIVRYIELAPQRISVRAGKRLTIRVETDASRYRWRLGGQRGLRRGKLLHLHAPTTPGTYRLVVTERGHSATALVRVRPK